MCRLQNLNNFSDQEEVFFSVFDVHICNMNAPSSKSPYPQSSQKQQLSSGKRIAISCCIHFESSSVLLKWFMRIQIEVQKTQRTEVLFSKALIQLSSDDWILVKAKGCIQIISQDTLTYFIFSSYFHTKMATLASAINMYYFACHLKNLVFLL